MSNAALADTTPRETPAKFRFDYFPVSLFGAVMGLTGLSIAWRLAHARYGAPEWIADGIAIAAIVTFVATAVAYAVKAITAFDAVVAEFRHPIAGSLFGTILISLLLLPIVIAPMNLMLARILWIAGAIGMFAFALMMIGRWLGNRQLIAHATPAWIVPVVGLLDVPLALSALGLPPMHGVMVMAVSVGLFFAVPLFTMIFSRLLFEPPMPEALQPMLLIMVAPFAVGFSAYVATTQQVDLFAQSLYMLTLFLLAAMLVRLRYLIVCCPFRVSWWAVSFPFAASAVAALRFSAVNPELTTDAIAMTLLALATIIIVALVVRTLVGIARGQLRALTS
jgi:tellurite resistance protein